MNKLAPIVLFTYNRLNHTKKTVEALKSNSLAIESELFIYSDGFKNGDDKVEVIAIRKYLKTIVGFKKIVIIEQVKNKGLADSIIDGVTQVVNKYGKIIVLEDDIVTSPFFLTFMNDALNYYQNIKKVWHISGWNYPINQDNINDTFLWRMMNCWGWATWKDRWSHYKKNPSELIANFTEYDIYKFDLDGGEGFWSQVLKNNSGDMNTWAIFWYATIFQKGGLCLNPVQSYVENIGFDGTGTNTGVRNNYSSSLCLNEKFSCTQKYYENDLVLYKIKNFLKNSDNNNLVFSKNINKIISQLESLDKSKKYVLYGAGSGAELILSLFSENIKYIVDNNQQKHNSRLHDKKVFSPYVNTKDYPIIISVFGRENSIKRYLIEVCNVNPSKIVCFTL